MTGGLAGTLAERLELLASRLMSPVLSGVLFSEVAVDGFVPSGFFDSLTLAGTAIVFVDELSATA
jgi:hypothetical protein